MTVGSAIMACCCDQPGGDPCVGIPWSQAPQELTVSGSIAATSWYREIGFGQASQLKATMSIQFSGVVQKGAQSGWNQGPNTNQLYSAIDMAYDWQVTQEVLEGAGTGDSETGSGDGAFFRIFCSKTGNGAFGLGPTPQALCNGEVIATPPYVIGRMSFAPPFPPTTPNGPPNRPSFPWGGVDQRWPADVSLFLNTNAGFGALSRFQPEVTVWVSTTGLTQGYQPARNLSTVPYQAISGPGCGALPLEYSRCDWATDYASLGANCQWQAGIIETQDLTVSVA
jgi:hypothetical protein